MAYNLTNFLEEFAHISNMGAIIVVILCLSLMSVYIYRLNGEMARRDEELRALQQVPKQMMGRVYNPFVLQLNKPHTASLSGGVSLQFTSQVPCILHVLWGATISHIYHFIHAPWQNVVDEYCPDVLHPLLDGKILQNMPGQHFAPHQDSREVHLDPPVGIDLGRQVPRDKYPLVVVCLDERVLQGEVQMDASENAVVCMVSLIHVRDEICTGESHVIVQYVRTLNPHSVFNLQQVYLTGESGEPMPSSPQNNSSPETSNHDSPVLCIICQTEHVNRVVLPCRHACVCDDCFQKLDRCPMCRGVIASYFTMDGVQHQSHEESHDFYNREVQAEINS